MLETSKRSKAPAALSFWPDPDGGVGVGLPSQTTVVGVCVNVTVVKLVDGLWFCTAGATPMGGKIIVAFVRVFEKYWCADELFVSGKSLRIGSERVSPTSAL